MADSPLTIAWVSDFPIEWLPDLPAECRSLPRRHPATWEMVLLSEFEQDPSLKMHVFLLRHRIERGFSFERNGVTFHVLKAKPWARLASLFWLDTLLIRRACRRIKPDLVHAWGTEKGAAMIAHRLRYPYLMTVQGLYGWYKERVPLGRYDRLMERFERISLKRAPLVTTESIFAVEYLKRRNPLLKIVQAEHAPNRLFSRVHRDPETQPIHFISIGTLGFRKGTDLLFKALDSLTSELAFNLTLICNANTGYIASLQQSVSAELWGRVEFKHELLPNEVAGQLERPTMLLLPTRADTSPNAVKEAVVAGVPVVASNVGGIPDYTFPDKNGLLFEPGDLDGFKTAIRAACRHPLFSRGQVDAETLARTRDYLSPARMARNFKAAYHQALTAQRAAGKQS